MCNPPTGKEQKRTLHLSYKKAQTICWATFSLGRINYSYWVIHETHTQEAHTLLAVPPPNHMFPIRLVVLI